MFNLTEYLIGCYYSKIPVMIWGDPGIGKSTATKQMAKYLSEKLEVIIASISEPSDFSGLPIVNHENQSVIFYPPEWTRTLANGGIVFFDEITTCNTSIQSAVLNIILEGKVGTHQLPENVYRIAAGNYSNISGCSELSLALTNRFVHLFHKADAGIFSELLIKEFEWEFVKIINNRNNIEEYNDKRMRYTSLLSKFILLHPNQLIKVPESITENNEVAYPTPRSWMYLIDILSTLDQNPKEYYLQLMKGAVGNDAAIDFMTYVEVNYKDLICVLDYVDRPEDMKYILRSDIVANILTQFLHYLRNGRIDVIPMVYHHIKFMNNNGFTSLVMSVIKELTASLIKNKELQSTILKEFEFIRDVAKYF